MTDCSIRVTADIEGSDDLLAVGAKRGFATVNRNTGELKYISKVWNEQDGEGREERYDQSLVCHLA